MRNLRNNFTSILTAVIVLTAMAQCDTTSNIEPPYKNYFIKYYGSDGNQSGVDMLVESDGTVLLLGTSKAAIGGSAMINGIYLVKADMLGEVIWERKLGTTSDEAKDIERTIDGNYIILSECVGTSGTKDMKLIKVSSEGTKLDSIVYGLVKLESAQTLIADEHPKSVSAFTDGTYLVTGTTELTGTWGDLDNPDPDLGDVFNIRFDQNLDVVAQSAWNTDILGFGSKIDVGIKAFQNGPSFYTLGYTNSNLSGSNPNNRLGFFYFRQDNTGSPGASFFPQVSTGSPGSSTDDVTISSVIATPASIGEGYIAVGTAVNQTQATSSVFVGKIPSSLAFSETDTRNTLFRPVSLGVTSGKRLLAGTNITVSLIGGAVGYIVVGNESRDAGAANIWVSKIDQGGNEIWSATFGSEREDDRGAAVFELPDGRILVLGTMRFANNQSKMVLIKLNSTGQLLD